MNDMAKLFLMLDQFKCRLLAVTVSDVPNHGTKSLVQVGLPEGCESSAYNDFCDKIEAAVPGSFTCVINSGLDFNIPTICIWISV